jgi:hypothetical protein
MGEVRIPADRLYGAQTRRAEENFPISDLRFGRRFLRALGLVKRAAADVNEELGLLDGRRASAIRSAATEVAEGELDEHFPLDIFQTGSGTSTNMNANEVIANRAIQELGGDVGSRDPVHPNDHVNLGQSSNDVIPTSIHVAALSAVEDDLIPAMRTLRDALRQKAREFDGVPKAGRTHLQDATPVRLGQEFGGYRTQVEKGIARVESTRERLSELADEPDASRWRLLPGRFFQYDRCHAECSERHDCGREAWDRKRGCRYEAWQDISGNLDDCIACSKSPDGGPENESQPKGSPDQSEATRSVFRRGNVRDVCLCGSNVSPSCARHDAGAEEGYDRCSQSRDRADFSGEPEHEPRNPGNTDR